MKGNIFKIHKIRAIVFFVVVAIGILATVQQIGRIQDSRQHAASDVTVQITSSSQAKTGEKVDSTIIIDNKAGKQINSFDITLTYDKQYIEYLQVLPAPPFQLIRTDVNKELGTVRLAGVVDKNNTVTSSAKAAFITFRAREMTPSTAISFANADIAALDDTKNVMGTIIGTKLSILDSGLTPVPTYNPTPKISKTKCDLNNDGKSNKSDYNSMLSCIKSRSWNGCINMDFRKNGKIDIDDLNIYLRSCPADR